MADGTRTLLGGCHCGQVRFEVDVPSRLRISDCNCSICEKSGYLALIVPAVQFRLLSGQAALTTYTFNTGRAQHHFCRYCGIKSFYVPRSHPEGVSVNARCLDEEVHGEAEVSVFNGQEWEAQLPHGRAHGFPNAL